MSPDISRSEVEAEFPQFEIIEEIRQGNIKQVYTAEYNGERVCLKIIPVGDNGRLREYTLREVEIMQRIDSEYFVDLVDSDETSLAGQQTIVLVEQYLEGGTLKDRIDNRETSVSLGIKVANTILSVLPEFAKDDIVHRDIKPGNVLFTSEGETRLIDAGVARMNQKDTLTPDFKKSGPGTPAYSAPEVLRNEKKKENTRSDLFSTGIVFFESITGEHPFNHTRGDASDAIREYNRLELSGYLDNQPLERDLNSFYLRMTEYEPMDRYRKPQHAQEDLVEIFNTHLK